MLQTNRMDRASRESPNRLTLLLFKDNLTARTFEVSTSWIYRMGGILLLLLCVTIMSLVATAQFYRMAHRGDPGRVNDLEKQLVDLKTSYQELEAKAAKAPEPVASAAIPGAQPSTEPSLASGIFNPQNIPNGSEPSASPLLPDGSAAVSGDNPQLFAGLPDSIQSAPDDPNAVPISIGAPRASWKGKTLQVRFNIQYVKTDKGSQQGRIIILARGPETVLGYPSGVFNRVGNDSLVAPSRGEYFSVSRFREVAADFGPVETADEIQEVEIVLLSQSGQLLLHRKITPEAKGHGQRKAESPEE